MAVTNMPLIACSMNVTYLNCNAAFLLGERFGKCFDENLQCHLSEFAFYFVASAIQNLHIKRDEGLISFAIADRIIFMS